MKPIQFEKFKFSAMMMMVESVHTSEVGLFQEQRFTGDQQKRKLGSSHTLQETQEKIRVAAMDVSLSVWKLDSSMDCGNESLTTYPFLLEKAQVLVQPVSILALQCLCRHVRRLSFNG